VITLDTAARSLAVMQRTPEGLYVNTMKVAVGGQPVSVVVGDIHGTGKLDAITANQKDGTVSIVHFPAAPAAPAPPAAKR
jgi:hypothetical protein